MAYKCRMTQTNQVKKPGTKTVWATVEVHEEVISEQKHNLISEASPFFRRLGGGEYVERDYTEHGYNVVKIISTSPDKTQRTIREFDQFEREIK